MARGEEVLRIRGEGEEASGGPGVRWATNVVDNEDMGKHKSKCCCIYHKPKKWDESDSDESDEDGETDHCRGHKQKKKNPPPPAEKDYGDKEDKK